MSNLIEIRKLNVTIGAVWPVRDADLDIGKGEIHCLVGESGCGKSLTALALMGILPRGANYLADRLMFDGADLLSMPPAQLRGIHGDQIAMIFQDPMTSLNPLFTIGFQLTESYLQHVSRDRDEARDRAIDLLEKVGIRGAFDRMGEYPHQLSGGMRQRVMIAMALMCHPKLIIADEPTTALDVTIQAQILDLIVTLTEEFGVGMLLITHDLGVVAKTARRVSVMYAGQIVETGLVQDVLGRPAHPYTQALLSCVPVPGKTGRGEHLGSIDGVVPQLVGDLDGCHFRNRCPYVTSACQGTAIPLIPLGSGRSARCILLSERVVQ